MHGDITMTSLLHLLYLDTASAVVFEKSPTHQAVPKTRSLWERGEVSHPPTLPIGETTPTQSIGETVVIFGKLASENEPQVSDDLVGKTVIVAAGNQGNHDELLQIKDDLPVASEIIAEATSSTTPTSNAVSTSSTTPTSNAVSTSSTTPTSNAVSTSSTTPTSNAVSTSSTTPTSNAVSTSSTTPTSNAVSTSSTTPTSSTVSTSSTTPTSSTVSTSSTTSTSNAVSITTSSGSTGSVIEVWNDVIKDGAGISKNKEVELRQEEVGPNSEIEDKKINETNTDDKLFYNQESDLKVGGAYVN